MGFGRPSDPRGETRGLSEIIRADAGKIKLEGTIRKSPAFTLEVSEDNGGLGTVTGDAWGDFQ